MYPSFVSYSKVIAGIIPMIGFSSSCSKTEKVSPPNILFCLADDISYPHMSTYGCSWVKTPGFDRVAREGILFTNAYTPNAKSAPSRSCILTGRNSWQLEEAANHICFFPAKFKTYPEVLSENGYFVGSTGKKWAPGEPGTINGNPRELAGKGWDHRKIAPPTKGISNNDYSGNFEEFLDARPGNKPFCFWYGSLEPHRGYEFGSSLDIGGKQPSEIDRVPAFWPDNDTVRTDMLDYAFEIEHFDSHLVRMIELLEERGLLDNTIIVVTADNGMPFPRAKGQVYEYSNHLPLAIMWGKGIKSPSVVEDYISFVDFAPTFLELAGVDAKESGMQPVTGNSLLDLFSSQTTGKEVPMRDFVLIGKERHDIGRPHDQGYPVRGLIRDGYLYVKNFKPECWPAGNPESGYPNVDGSPTKTICLNTFGNPETESFWKLSFGKRPGEELYKISEDPDCIVNLADSARYSELLNKMKSELIQKLSEQADPRIIGDGDIFDAYRISTSDSGFYERSLRGEKIKRGWLNPTDDDTIHFRFTAN